MTSPCDPQALWLKAKSFINRALSASDDGAFDEAGVWAACALELLGKAALSKINPLLVADPSDDGKSLLIAAGASSDHGGFKTIPAKAVFSRCARAFPAFNEKEAGRIAGNRNDELHSGSAPFSDLHEESWWERFWAQASILIAAQGEAIESFVGNDRAPAVEALLAKNAENLQRRVEVTVQRAKQRFAQIVTPPTGGARHLLGLAIGSDYEFATEQECPACESPGELMGDFVGSSEIAYDSDDGSAVEFLVVYAEEFLCRYCGLHLEGPETLKAAALPESFEIEREPEPEWDDYGND